MKKRALFFDCFYSFSSLLSPLSLSRLHFLSSKSKKLAFSSKAKATVKDHALYTSAINGQLSAILFFVHLNWSLAKFDPALVFAALGGHIDLCKYFIKIGATDFNVALAYAAEGGHKDLCHYFIKLGAKDFNYALANAAEGGHLDICKYLIKLGATNFKSALGYAKDQPTKDFLIQAQNEKKGLVL